MNRKLFHTVFLAILLLCTFTIQPASSMSLIDMSYEDLYTNSDYVILGTVVDEADFQTYTYYTMTVENSYKNALNETTIVVLGEILYTDYPKYMTKLNPEKQYLLFLTDTGTEYQGSKVYEVYGVIQGEFRVEDGVASNGLFNIVINEDEIRVADDGKMIFKSINFPDDMTVYDFKKIGLRFYNEGGQFVRQTFNVSFIGCSDTSVGEKISKLVEVKGDAGRSITKKIALNMSKPGLFNIFVNGTYIEDVMIHESGYGSQGYNFSNIRIELSDLDWLTYKIVFDVTSEVSGESEVYYRMVVNSIDDPNHYINTINTPLKSEFEEAGTVTQWYSLGENPMGTRKIVIWYKGIRVLETTVDLKTGDTNLADNGDETNNSIPGFTLFTSLIGLTISITLKELKKNQT